MIFRGVRSLRLKSFGWEDVEGLSINSPWQFLLVTLTLRASSRFRCFRTWKLKFDERYSNRIVNCKSCHRLCLLLDV